MQHRDEQQRSQQHAQENLRGALAKRAGEPNWLDGDGVVESDGFEKDRVIMG